MIVNGFDVDHITSKALTLPMYPQQIFIVVVMKLQLSLIGMFGRVADVAGELFLAPQDRVRVW